MKPLPIILATVVIFFAGIATGALGSRYHYQERIRVLSERRPPMPGPSGMMRRDFLERMDKDLALTPGQRTAIEQLLKESQERTKEFWEPIAPQMHAEFKSVRGKISEVLTPEQRSKFERSFKSREHHRKFGPGGEKQHSEPDKKNCQPGRLLN